MISGLKFLCLVAMVPALAAGADEPVEYGADVSFPMQHVDITTNYPWLEHNMDKSKPVPKEYQDMVLQPLGDKTTFYKDYLQGCVDSYGKKGGRCRQTEIDRIEMTLRQPQSMQNYVSSIGHGLFLYEREGGGRLCNRMFDSNNTIFSPKAFLFLPLQNNYRPRLVTKKSRLHPKSGPW